MVECQWDKLIPFDLMWKELKRFRNDNTPIVLFGSEPFSSALRMSNIKEFKYDWIWKKNRTTGFQLSKKRPLKDFENVSVFYNKQPLYINTKLIKLDKPIDTYRKNKGGSIINTFKSNKEHKRYYTGYNRMVLEFKNEHNVGKYKHPTQKPIALLEYLIKTYTNEGDTVLDFTSGSFSTAIACINTNRKFIGIEKDEKYFEVGKNRIIERLNELK